MTSKQDLISRIKAVAKERNISTYSFCLDILPVEKLKFILHCFELPDYEIDAAYQQFKKIMPNYAYNIRNEYKTSGYYRCGLIKNVENLKSGG